MTDYKIAVYIRLSLADEDTGYNKTESDSIGNQRKLINHFLDEHTELKNCNRTEFADDGYTATNFLRPRFTEMIDKVKSGEINAICVKDFSRFSRDYIETGNYLECVFPFLGVRFISINDNYDSEEYKGTTGGLEVVMRNIIYAAYSKDLSIKTTTAKVQMMKQGKYVGGYAPYGYKMHDTVRNKLTIDEDAAKVVKLVFDMALDGKNTSQIAKVFNDNHLPTPGQYFRSKYPNNNKFKFMSDKISWTSAMIYKVLVNRLYTGALISHKRKSIGLGSRKTVLQEPIIVEGTHEAIVTQAEFEQAQAVIRKGNKEPKRTVNEYPLRSLIYCGNCKRVLTRCKRKNASAVFRCTHSTHDKDSDCPKDKEFAEDMLEQVAFNAIGQFVALAEKQQAVTGRKDLITECMDKLRFLQTQAEQLKVIKLRLYEKYTEGDISKAEYLKQKTATDERIAENKAETKKAQERIELFRSDNTQADRHLETLCKAFTATDTLTYDLAHAFIKAISIGTDGSIEIEWKFKNIFD